MSGPPPPYIPPPPPPPHGWAPPKPTSGKAIASLICGMLGLIGVMCYLPVLAGLAGIILGVLGIIESGRNGTRSGRGLAIAGTIVSVLSVLAFVAMVGTFVALGHYAQRQAEVQTEAMLAEQQEMLLERMKAYHAANEGSLGPGGPIPEAARERGGPERVSGPLTPDHLLSAHEMNRVSFAGGKWEITLTGQSSATLRFTRHNELMREIVISDIANDKWIQTFP